MVEKNKNSITKQKIETIASYAGTAVMMLATVISMAELSEREGHRVATVLQPQPAYAVVNDIDAPWGHGDERTRRGRDEIRHSSENYGEVMHMQKTAGSA